MAEKFPANLAIVRFACEAMRAKGRAVAAARPALQYSLTLWTHRRQPSTIRPDERLDGCAQLRGSQVAFGDVEARVGLLFDRLRAASEGWGAVDVLSSGLGHRLRFASAEGFRSFLLVEAQPDSLFSALARAEIATLVGTVESLSDEVVEFLAEANAVTVGGTWEYLQGTDGVDIGVTGQLLLADAASPVLPGLITQLLALQVEAALKVSRPAWIRPLTEPDDGPRPLSPLAAQRPPKPVIDLGAVAERIWWRSGYHDNARWHLETADMDTLRFRAPSLATGQTLTAEGEPRADLREVLVALADHPTAGPGLLIQVAAQAESNELLLRYRTWSITTQAGRWFGSGLGGFLLWGDDPVEVAYRVFLPLDLLGVLEPVDMMDLIADAALGAVNIVGVAEATADALDDAVDTDMVDEDLEDTIAEALEERAEFLRRRWRLAAHRAATHLARVDDETVDMGGPLIDVGAAALDRLAVDQLQIHTAPHLLGDRTFSWLPGPHIQQVVATRMKADRFMEVSELVVSTDIGGVPRDQLRRAKQLSVTEMAALPLSSLVIDSENRLRITSRVTLHEGVWWHRCELLAVVAALQLHCAEWLAEQLRSEGLQLVEDSPLRSRLVEDDDPVARDPIFEVLPSLRSRPKRPGAPSVEHMVRVARSRLLDEPFSRPFGDADEEPGVVVGVSGLDPDGGWDPILGEALVDFRTFEHPVAGDCLVVEVDPGWPVDEERRVDEAVRLTAFTHGRGGVALCPAWTLTHSSVGVSLVIPRLAIGFMDLDQGATVVSQAVRSCVQALANAVTYRDGTFPEYDRSQIHLGGRRKPTSLPDHVSSDLVTWAPQAGLRTLAIRQLAGAPASAATWLTTDVTLDAATAFRKWSNGEDNSLLFGHHRCDLSAERRAHGIMVNVGAWALPFTFAEASQLAAQLAAPEGPALGVSSGLAVINPLSSWFAEDQHALTLLLPPAPALTRIVTDQALRVTAVEVASTSLLLRLRSSEHEACLELFPDDFERAARMPDADGHVYLQLAFPHVDGRVTEPPPDSRTVTLYAEQLRGALQALE